MDKRKVVLERYIFQNHCTIGRLMVDGALFCNTLEDRDRGLTSEMSLQTLKIRKIWGITAIPSGTYQVKKEYMANHKVFHYMLHDVPAYSGIFVHAGSNDVDTYGCILLGLYTGIEDQIVQSRANVARFEAFMNNEPFELTVVRVTPALGLS